MVGGDAEPKSFDINRSFNSVCVCVVECIVDLLNTGDKSSNSTSERESPRSPQGKQSTTKPSLDVRVTKQGTYVEDLITVEVTTNEDVVELMALGHGQRHVGSHNANLHSSRSHLVLTITIESTSLVTSKKKISRLNLIDLAGSERVSKTAASGQRLKEAQNINRSLSALGDVIAALGSQSKHVPYRNSKLVRRSCTVFHMIVSYLPSTKI